MDPEGFFYFFFQILVFKWSFWIYGFILFDNLENNIKGKTLWKALTLP